MWKGNNSTKNNELIKSLIIKGKILFWAGSLMVSSSMTWLFVSFQDWNDINTLKIPIIFLVIGIALIIMFKECQFFMFEQPIKSKK